MESHKLTLARLTGRPALPQQLRYLLSGGATFIVEYGSFLVFSYLMHLNIYVALTLSFLLALAVGFVVNHLWTFKSASGVPRRLIAYTALALLNLGFNYLVVPGLGHVGVPHALGKVFAQSCVVAWNYVLMSRWIFAPATPGSGDLTGSS